MESNSQKGALNGRVHLSGGYNSADRRSSPLAHFPFVILGLAVVQASTGGLKALGPSQNKSWDPTWMSMDRYKWGQTCANVG